MQEARRKAVEDRQGNESKSHHHPQSILRMSVSVREFSIITLTEEIHQGPITPWRDRRGNGEPGGAHLSQTGESRTHDIKKYIELFLSAKGVLQDWGGLVIKTWIQHRHKHQECYLINLNSFLLKRIFNQAQVQNVIFSSDKPCLRR